MARPSIITVILFNFLSFWNEYIIALTLMPGKNQTLPVGLKNLIQAQRDYFGAHTFERTDKEGSYHYDWVGNNEK